MGGGLPVRVLECGKEQAVVVHLSVSVLGGESPPPVPPFCLVLPWMGVEGEGQ